MTFGVVGLGLIGGSFAKAIKNFRNDKVLGFDTNEKVLKSAIEDKTIDLILNNDNLKECDVVFIGLYPKGTVDFVKKQRNYFKNGAIVIDLCGVKNVVTEQLEECVKSSNFTFIGGHPMAGTENTGYESSKPTLFKGASMILTPYKFTKNDIIESVKPIFSSLGFEKVVITDSKTHDAIIAYTSQLAHVVSNAYVKSPTALKHHGFSAGSYRDMTRVAKLNENMWAELFLDNKEPLIYEIDNIINELNLYKTALENEDKNILTELLKDGREKKEKVDSK